jgi:hypothetical protein
MPRSGGKTKEVAGFQYDLLEIAFDGLLKVSHSLINGG